MRRPVGLLTALILSACTSATVPPAGPVMATINAGARPGAAVTGAGAVWVPNTGDGTVSRIDPSTNRVTATIAVGDAAAFFQRDCLPYGSVHSFMVTTFNVRRCDLPSSVAAGNGGVWAAKNDTKAVVRIDPASNRIVSTVDIGVLPFELLATPDAVWVTSYFDDAVVRIDPTRGQVTATIRTPGQGPSGIISADGQVWVVDSRGSAVSQIDPGRNQVVGSIAIHCPSTCLGGAVPLPVAATEGSLWVRNEGDGTLVRIERASAKLTATIDIGAFWGRDGQDAIAVADGGLWLSGISLQRIDPHTNRLTHARDYGGIALAAGYGSLWVTDQVGRILRIDPRRLQAG
jgi:YVTN family beta-propeller protein